MNSRIQQLATQCGLKANLDDIKIFTDLLLIDVLSEFNNADAQHCALTTYDLNTVANTQRKITNHIIKTYGIGLSFGKNYD